MIVDGTDDDILRAETILRRRGIHEWGIYDAAPPDVDTRRSDYTSDVVDRRDRAVEPRDRIIDPRDRVL